MTASVIASACPILQFFDNSGKPAANGSLLTQVGGVNFPTYSDLGVTPLPNPIPLNSRGEVSNAVGQSSQLFLQNGVTYTFTLFDANGNFIWSAPHVNGATTSANVIQFGADPTGVSDSTTAFNAAVTSLGPLGGTIIAGPGKFFIASNLTIPANVTLQGPFEMPGINGPQNSYNFATMSAIRLSSTATITLGYGAGIVGCLIYMSGLSFPQLDASNFAGTGVTIAGDDTFIMRSMILGFNQGISFSGFNRGRFIDILMDNINDVAITNSEDITYLTRIHCWPFVTYGLQPTANANRSGTAFNINNIADFIKVTECFAYGYLNGFVVNTVNNCAFTNCSVDMTNNAFGLTATGFNFSGLSNNCRIIGGTISFQGTGVVVNTSAPIENAVKLIGVDIFGPGSQTAVSVTHGYCVAVDCSIADYAIGFDDSSGVGPPGVQVTDCYFDTVTTPLNLIGGGKQVSTVRDNIYFNCSTTVPDQKYITGQPPEEQINVFGTSGGYVFQNLLARGTIASPTIVSSGDNLWGLSGFAYNGTSYISTVALRGQVNGTLSGAAMPSQIVLSATPAASNTIVDMLVVTGSGVSVIAGAFSPATPAAAAQGGSIYQGTGVPSNSNGNNGDIYFRTDTPGTANQRIYIKSAGSWTGIV